MHGDALDTRAGTEETREDTARLVLANLDAFLTTGAVLTPVSRPGR